MDAMPNKNPPSPNANATTFDLYHRLDQTQQECIRLCIQGMLWNETQEKAVRAIAFDIWEEFQRLNNAHFLGNGR